jgi:hypothetical protein
VGVDRGEGQQNGGADRYEAMPYTEGSGSGERADRRRRRRRR